MSVLYVLLERQRALWYNGVCKRILKKAKEILDWLDMHKKIENWVAIGDLDLHNERIFRQKIKPGWTIGLTQQDIERAETMLSEKENKANEQTDNR